LDLRDWGYDLKLPGEYVLIGCALIDRPKLTLEATVRSNRATFRIMP
jgi:hypothetical protein